MPVRSRILLIDTNDDDVELARLLIARELPDCELVVVPNAMALAANMSEPAPAVIVFAADVDWTSFSELRTLTGGRWPSAAYVLFARADALNSELLGDGTDFDAIAHKTSGGFMALPRTITQLIERNPAADMPAGDLETLPVPTVRVDSAGGILACNQRFATVFGRTAEALSGTGLGELLNDEDTRQRLRQFLAGTAGEILVPCGTQNRALCLQRDSRGALGCLLPAPAPGMRLIGERTAGAGTQEESELALLFAHDLRQPIQQMQRLLERMRQEPDFSKLDRARTMNQLTASAERASSMLEGLAEYLSVTLNEAPEDAVDLNDCVSTACEHLQLEIEQSGATIDCEALPSVQGDTVQLTHMFQNLVGNALKFRSHSPPRITISAEPYDGAHHIAVTDNGIGIGAAHRERVFGLGQRLHTREEYPGSGMGLALCRRVVERHGGAIRIEPGPNGEGTCVLVSLPQISAANSHHA